MPALRPIDQWLIDEVLPHESAYLAVARRVSRSDDEAADLVQEALAKLIALDGWAAISHPRAYMIRSIQNLAIRRLRRAKIVEFQQLTEIDTLDLRDEAPDPFRVLAAKEEVGRLTPALASLPERSRTVIVRRRFRGEASTAIARDLGISLSTFEKRLTRALYLLARALDGGVAQPEAAESAEEDPNRAIG